MLDDADVSAFNTRLETCVLPFPPLARNILLDVALRAKVEKSQFCERRGRAIQSDELKGHFFSKFDYCN